MSLSWTEVRYSKKSTTQNLTTHARLPSYVKMNAAGMSVWAQPDSPGTSLQSQVGCPNLALFYGWFGEDG